MAVQESEWISVEAGVPGVGEVVLARGYGKDMTNGMKLPFEAVATWTADGWSCEPVGPFPYLHFIFPYTVLVWRRTHDKE